MRRPVPAVHPQHFDPMGLEALDGDLQLFLGGRIHHLALAKASSASVGAPCRGARRFWCQRGCG